MRVGLSLPVQGSSNLSKEAIVSSLQGHSDACDVHFQITYRIRLTGRGSNTYDCPYKPSLLFYKHLRQKTNRFNVVNACAAVKTQWRPWLVRRLQSVVRFPSRYWILTFPISFTNSFTYFGVWYEEFSPKCLRGSSSNNVFIINNEFQTSYQVDMQEKFVNAKF